jgi:histidine triad (HIT) family protein
MQDCTFCRIIRKEISSKIVYEDEEMIAIEDINPQAPLHFLIVPRKHIATTLDLGEKEKELVGSVFLLASKLAKERGIGETGFRIVHNCNPHGGQTVYHIHFHLLGGRPMRWPPG